MSTNTDEKSLGNVADQTMSKESDESLETLFKYTSQPNMTRRKEKTAHNSKTTIIKKRLLSIFPIFEWIKYYSPKNDLLCDAIAGCSVSVMQVPQGLAAAILAGVPPITGLYMAFFPAFTYIFLGTSRHISLGTIAVVCIMTKSIVALYAKLETVNGVFENPPDLSLTDAIFEPENAELTSVQVAVVVCFAVGLWQFAMGCLRFGKVSVILSENLVGGFCTASAVHILISQLDNFLGVTVGKYNGDFKIVLVVRDAILNISSMNFISFAISSLTTAVLLIHTEIIKPRLEKRCTYPVPVELLCLVAGTLVSMAFDLGPKHDVKCVGTIPKGLPTPSFPPLWLLPKVIFHSLPIALVGYTIALSMASVLAKKGHYKIRANQEFIALGASNIFSSFFACVPISASLSRSLIQQNVGGKTQIASLFASAVVLVIMLFVGPFFEPLPQSVLAAIMMVTLKGMLWQVKEVPAIWRRSTMDGLVWVGTFFVSVFWDIDYGLGTGICLSVLSVLLYGQKVQIYLIGRVPNSEIYLDLNRYKVATEVPGVTIIHISGSLHFANKNQLEDKTRKLLDSQVTLVKNEETLLDLKRDLVIFDVSSVSFLDPSATDILLALRAEISIKRNSDVSLAGCQPILLESLKKFGYFTDVYSMKNHTFPTVHQAVLHWQNNQEQAR